MDKSFDLAYELRKCTECSCSRCNLCGTLNCYVEIAIKELSRYDQAMDSLRIPNGIFNGDIALLNVEGAAQEIPADYVENH